MLLLVLLLDGPNPETPQTLAGSGHLLQPITRNTSLSDASWRLGGH